MTRTRTSTLTKVDRMLIGGLVVVLTVGVTVYVFRNELAEQYERRFQPERYWSTKVKSLRFSVALGELQRQECMVDLLAARTKESIRVTRQELLGISSSAARTSAAEETAAQGAVCEAIAKSVRADRERLAAAERELEEIGESPSFTSAWNTVTPSWREITSKPKFQALDDEDKEAVRLDYWKNYVSPMVPTEELRRARRQFDRLTGKR